MKKVLGLLLVLICSQNIFASNLIFKTVLDTKTGLSSETLKINTSNVRQIRIYIKKERKSERVDEDEAFFTDIYAIDDEQELPLISSTKSSSNFNMLFETPPPVIKIAVSGQGKFYIYVWGS